MESKKSDVLRLFLHPENEKKRDSIDPNEISYFKFSSMVVAHFT
jgi:hypothetical protein